MFLKPHISLAAYPDLVATFHPTRNGSLRPEQVSHGSDKKLWWKCPEGPDHEWQATPLHRKRPSGGGCPFCAGKRASATNSLATQNPRIARQWHPTRNAPLMPHDVVIGSEKKAWWKCPRGPDHEWRAVISSRARYGCGCPFCAGIRVSVTNALATLDPELAREWHPTRNGKLTPRDVTTGSDRKVWWRCQRNLHHAWLTTVPKRRRGTGCPRCLGLYVGLARSLGARRPQVARMWHPTKNGALSPFGVTAHSRRRVWWKCSEGPDHEFSRPVAWQVACKEKCPFCANTRVSVTNSLARRFPAIARQWHPTRNGKLTPHDVVYGSASSYWWVCASGHEWRTLLNNRTRFGSGCPHCRLRKRRPAMTRRVREVVRLPSYP